MYGEGRSYQPVKQSERKPIEPIVLSPAFLKLHHFHVLNTQTGELLGMFASLYCAAQTALDTHVHDGSYALKFVRDTKTGYDFTYTESNGGWLGRHYIK